MPAVQSREKTRIKSCGPGTPPFTRNKVGTPGRDEILVDFPVGAHNCALAMGEAASGLGNIDGKNCYRNSTTTSKVKLVDERRYAVLLKVRRIGEAAAIDVLLDSHPQLRTQSPSEEVKRETLGLLTLGRQFVAALTSSARPLGDCPRQTNCRKAAQTEASDNDGTDISGGGPASRRPKAQRRKFRRTRSSSRLRRAQNQYHASWRCTLLRTNHEGIFFSRLQLELLQAQLMIGRQCRQRRGITGRQQQLRLAALGHGH